MAKVKEITSFIINNNQPEDEAFIVSVIGDGNPALLVEPTRDKSSLLDGLNSLKTRGGPTTLLDGIYSAADYLSQLKSKRADGRCALIVVSDGEDRASETRPEKIVGLLKVADCPLFFIGYLDELDRKEGFVRESPYTKAQRLIERLTKETGGKAIFVDKKSDLKKLAAEFNKVLRN